MCSAGRRSDPLSTREAVARDTPASRATWERVTALIVRSCFLLTASGGVSSPAPGESGDGHVLTVTLSQP
ncbi:hypothetical protein GCM10009767_00240 [Kocuria aegyptia]|uniref:Uncharacterized protein n=1 Tax=Kocuria aegyptia TaxID=330943 RepID=A0ABN2K0E4_9MICC